MVEDMTVFGDHPTKGFWLDIMLLAQTHLLRAKVWDRDLTNRAIRDGTPWDPPLPDDFVRYRDFIVSRDSITMLYRKNIYSLDTHVVFPCYKMTTSILIKYIYI